MMTVEFITALFSEVDEQMRGVAYLKAADNVSGPLPIRLPRVN